jgi:hypothetical protein
MNNKKWEYKIVRTLRDDYNRNGLEELFNQLGSSGWELVGYVMNDGTNGRFVGFKRKVS